MKKLLTAVIVVVTFAGSSMAQNSFNFDGFNNQEINTVFKREKRDGFYGAISVAYSPINGDNGMVFSSRGGWIMDHWFAFGLAGSGFVNNLENIDNYSGYSANSDGSLNLGGGYGGIFIEPMAFPLKPIHLSFPILFGVGAAGAFDNYYYSTVYDQGDVFYVVEPGVELEFNFTRWLRIAFFGTYRYTSDIEIENIAKDALRSYSTGVTIKVGLF